MQKQNTGILPSAQDDDQKQPQIPPVRCAMTSKKDDFLLRLWNRLQWGWECRVGDGFAEGERELLLGVAVAVVGADDALDEVVADDVDVFEVAEADAFDAVQDVEGFEEAGFFWVGQVDLG